MIEKRLVPLYFFFIILFILLFFLGIVVFDILISDAGNIPYLNTTCKAFLDLLNRLEFLIRFIIGLVEVAFDTLCLVRVVLVLILIVVEAKVIHILRLGEVVFPALRSKM